jgi:glycosyltransferase involved in cell wall biosynthesis/peptidoglycan/xylan/chitin deacetylase (PgdA/CDA1 family)
MGRKILHVIGQLVRGGSERQLLLVSSALAKCGWSQAVVTFCPGSAWDGSLQARRIALFAVKQSPLKLARLLRFCRIVAREKPDIVHSWSHHTTVYAAWARRLFHFKLVASLRHNPSFDNQTGRWLGAMPYRELYAAADCVLSNSYVSLAMARAAGLSPKSQAVVGNIVTNGLIGNPGLATACPNILTIGSLTELKGHQDLIQALTQLAAQGLDFRLFVVGDGPKRQELEAMASTHPLQGRVEFVGELDDVGSLISKCQMLVHPSRMEGLSNAILEGMASGLAVCATAVGATPEYVVNGSTGLLVPPYHPPLLASSVKQLLADPALRARLGQAAAKVIHHSCSSSLVSRQYENCYRSLLAGPTTVSAPAGARNSPRWPRVLMYHNIVDKSTPRIPVAGHQVTEDALRRQMALLRGKVLDPREVQRKIATRQPLPKGYVITFDDGAGGLLQASRILAELNLTGVAFVCPGALKTGLWLYRLADALARTEAEALCWRGLRLPLKRPEDNLSAYRVLYQCLHCELPALRDGSLQDLLEHLRPPPGPPLASLQTLDEAGLKAAAANGSLLFANHSWSHPNLPALPQEQILQEIQQAQTWLEQSSLPTLPWFAFPQGYFDHRVLKVAHDAGLVPFGSDLPGVERQVCTRIGIYRKDSNLARFKLKLRTKSTSFPRQFSKESPCASLR